MLRKGIAALLFLPLLSPNTAFACMGTEPPGFRTGISRLILFYLPVDLATKIEGTLGAVLVLSLILAGILFSIVASINERSYLPLVPPFLIMTPLMVVVLYGGESPLFTLSPVIAFLVPFLLLLLAVRWKSKFSALSFASFLLGLILLALRQYVANYLC